MDIKVFWTQAALAVSVLKGPALLGLIAVFLNSEEQGVWFTFVSLGAFVFVADLGFTNIITQYISHGIKDDNEGEQVNLETASVIISSAIAYMVVVATVGVFLFGYGAWFFGGEYTYPWGIYVLSNVLYLFFSLAQAVSLGFDNVVSVNKEKALVQLVIAFTTCLMLAFGMGIWALVIGFSFGTFVFAFKHAIGHGAFWRNIYELGWPRRSVSCLRQLGSLQLKFAISWICGYFIFQLYTPYVFKHQGAVLAGQIGLCIAIFTSITQFTNAYVVAYYPKIGQLVGANEERKAKKLFLNCVRKKVLVHSLIIIAGAAFLTLIEKIDLGQVVFNKLPPATIIIAFAIIFLLSGIISNFAGYIRAHREEKFVLHAIFNAAGVVTSLLFVSGLENSLISIALFYCFFLFPAGGAIFLSKCKLYDKAAQ